MNGSLNSHGRGLGSVASKMTASASSAASTLKMNMNMTTTTTNGHSNISGTGGSGRLGNGVNSGINKNMNVNGIGKNYTSAPTPTSTSTSLPSTATSSASVSSSAASKAKTVSYEQFAPKSSELRSRLSKIQNLTCGPIADAVKSKATSDKQGLGGVSSSGSGNGNGNVSDDFFLQAMAPKGGRSHSHSSSSKNTTIDGENGNSCENTPQAQIKKTLALTQKTSSHITQILNTTNNLHATLTRTTNFATTITNRHSSLLQHSSELSHAAERLQSESDQLAHHAKEIGLPLKHYDAVDRLGLVVGVLFKNGMVVKGIARVKVDQDDFKSVLVDVDDAVNFFAERSESVSANQSQAQAQDNINNASADANNTSSSQPDENSAASGSVEYYKRALALQEACMDLFKESIAQRIQQTSTQVMSALDLKRKSVSGDTLEASMIYTRYHGISSRSQLLLSMIKKRKEEKCVLVPSTSAMSVYKRKSSANVGGKGDMVCPYSELWNVCRNTYIQSRLSLLKLSVRNHLDFLKEKHGLIGMTRLASVFLMRLCTTETAMYLDFFGNVENEMEAKAQTEAEAETGTETAVKSDEASNGNGRANDKESGSITTSREAKVAQSNTNGYGAEKAGKKKKDAATLASQVMAKDGTYYDSEFQAFLDELCNNLHRTIRRGIVSIMELDTLCQIVSVLREERSLANASPTTMAAARSLGRVIFDAQERLIFCANGALSKEVVRFKAVPADLDYPDKLRKCKEQRDENKQAGAENDPLLLQMQIYESWFPPIRSVLKVLSKIFRVVEPKVFEDIALSSVQACSKSLKEGSSYVEKKSGQLHSDLFLVKHLLVSDILFTVPKLLSHFLT